MMKVMFLFKKSQPNIDQTISFLSPRVNDTNKGDWKKLFRFLDFLKGTINNLLMLEANDTNTLKWYINVAFVVQAGMKIHTEAVLKM